MMRTFSKRWGPPFVLLLAAASALGVQQARADGADQNPGGKTAMPEEDDFSGNAYTDYAEFNNQEAEEEADERFFQYGRFFGISVGAGYDVVTGNRGLLWQGGFPTLEFKLHYWFDFNFAMCLDVYTASHFFDHPDTAIGHEDVTLTHLGLELKYYIDVKNLSSTISFANPYIIAGVGPYTKTQTATAQNATDTDTSIGFSGGAGFEFAVAPKKVYFEVEGRIHVVHFKDTFTTEFSGPSSLNLDDLTGNFWTLTGHILFTW